MKKFIAITQRISQNNSYQETRESLDIQYIEMLKSLDLIPIVISSKSDWKEYFNTLSIEGLILTGGNDLYCCNKNQYSYERDKFEKNLITYCIEKEIPILGICRGMQIIAEYFNSSIKKVKNQVATRDTLIINKKSKFFKNLNNLRMVNSFHNYAIEKTSNELIISATNKEGVIKAIEHKEHKILAHMWHPEREQPFDKLQLKIIHDFIKGDKI